MEAKVNGIVIRAVDFGENDQILTLFTLEEGVVSAKIKGVKKAGGKLKFAVQPFCFCEYILNIKGENRTVINASLNDGFYHIREDVLLFYAASSVTEFVKKFCPENLVAKEIFSFSLAALKSLSEGKEPYAVLINYFLNSLAEAGYGINFDGCANCGGEINGRIFFDFELGGAVCANCMAEERMEISVKTYNALKEIYQSGVSLEEAEYLKRALKFIAYYIGVKTGEKIKSLEDFLRLN